MMLKKIYIIIVLISLSFADLSAQETAKFRHSIGGGLGFTTGYGLSYRTLFNDFGVQVNFAPYKENEEITLSTGLSFIYQLFKSEKLVLFIYQGNHYNYKKYWHVDYGGYNEINTLKTKTHYNTGIGLGLDYIIHDRICMSFMGGQAFYDRFEQLGFTAEFGIYYRF
jgi:hypothetical protein